MTLYVRDLTNGQEKQLAVPCQYLELEPEHEYIIIDSDLPFEVSEYDNIAEINTFLREMHEIGYDRGTWEAIGKSYLFSEIKEVIDSGKGFSVINYTEETKDWNYSNGGNGSEDEFGLILYKEGISYLPFTVPSGAEDYIRWEQNWYAAESDGWRMSKDQNHNTYLIRLDH